MYIDKSIIKIIDGLLIDWVICSNKQNGQDCYDTSEVAHFSWVIANQKEIIPICWPAIMTVFEFPPRLSLSRNVNTESLYGTNSFFRKDGRLDVVEELMEFSAERKMNTTCISCVTDVWRGNKKDAREQKRTREGGHLVPIRSLRKNFPFRVARERASERWSREGLLSNLVPRSRARTWPLTTSPKLRSGVFRSPSAKGIHR